MRAVVVGDEFSRDIDGRRRVDHRHTIEIEQQRDAFRL